MIRLMTLLLLCFSISYMGQAKAESQNSCDILIDVGHGGIDGGTSNHGILEKDINLAVGKKLYAQLKRKGYKVKLTRSEDIALSELHPSKNGSRHLRDLQSRQWMARTLNPRLLISLHVNWSSDRKYSGPIVLHQRHNKESLDFAKIAQKHLNQVYGIHRQTVKGKTYFILNRVQIPAVIVEMGFMSNMNDLRLLTQEKTQEQIVFALSKAVDEYFQVPMNIPNI